MVLAVWYGALSSSGDSQACLDVRCLNTALFGPTASGQCLSGWLNSAVLASPSDEDSPLWNYYGRKALKKIKIKYRPKAKALISYLMMLPSAAKAKGPVQWLSDWDLSAVTEVENPSFHLPIP